MRALVALALVALGCSPPPVGGLVGTPPAGRLYHAAYPGSPLGKEATGAGDDVTPAALDAYEAASGRRVAWVYFTDNWYMGRDFPSATVAWIAARGALPFVRLLTRSSQDLSSAEPVFPLQAIVDGKFDADFAAWGDGAARFGGPLAVELFTEMNGDWFSWNSSWNGGGDKGTALFRDAFRHIVDVVRGRGASNVTWVFHVNDVDSPPDGWNHFENYYPGDDYVDWVGVSDYGAQVPLQADCPRFVDGMDAVAPRLRDLASSRPIYVFEMGVTSGNAACDPVAWADDALGALVGGRWPEVRGFSWWNEAWHNDADPAHDTDMRVQSVPGLSSVFQKRLASSAIVDAPLPK